MNFCNWVERNRDKFGSEYELLFVTEVLPLVSDLQVNALTAQHHFVDNDGKDRYCNFTIVESETVRVAIEIDGYDKRGTGTGMSYEDFLNWQRRQASLASQGWQVLRFANRDVREEPHRCAEHISRLLSRLRQAQIGRVEIVTIHSKPPELIVVPVNVVDATSLKIPSNQTYKFFPFIALSLLVVFAIWQKNSDKPVIKLVPPTLPASVVPSDSLPLRYVSPEISQPDVFPERKLAPVGPVVVPLAFASKDAGSENFLYGTLNCRNPLD